MAAKSIRKSVSFDDSDGDRALLDAIATHQAEHQQSFSDLCKQALHQYLLGREAPQPVLLFMELQHQIAQLGARVAALEDNASIASAFGRLEPPTTLAESDAEPVLSESTDLQTDTENNASEIVEDPVISRLGPLLDDF